MTTPTEEVKTSTKHVDTISAIDEPIKPQIEELDKFGAALVQSAAERALVKKLDLHMMVLF